MSAERLVANLLRVAHEDLKGARLLASQGNRNAFYLCEQSAEKVIRAVLTSEGTHAGVGHQLTRMVDMVPDANPMKQALRALESLSAYATTFRYPSAVGALQPAPPAQVFHESAKRVEDALNAVVTRFKVDLTKTDAPAGSAEPIR